MGYESGPIANDIGEIKGRFIWRKDTGRTTYREHNKIYITSFCYDMRGPVTLALIFGFLYLLLLLT